MNFEQVFIHFGKDEIYFPILEISQVIVSFGNMPGNSTYLRIVRHISMFLYQETASNPLIQSSLVKDVLIDNTISSNLLASNVLCTDTMEAIYNYFN